MSILTKTERDGLEDVFLSIHSNTDKYKKFRDFSSIIIGTDISTVLSKLLKHTKIGLKRSKSSTIITFFTKKKKYLSK